LLEDFAVLIVTMIIGVAGVALESFLGKAVVDAPRGAVLGPAGTGQLRSQGLPAHGFTLSRGRARAAPEGARFGGPPLRSSREPLAPAEGVQGGLPRPQAPASLQTPPTTTGRAGQNALVYENLAPAAACALAYGTRLAPSLTSFKAGCRAELQGGLHGI
jgi:hypothetical protein